MTGKPGTVMAAGKNFSSVILFYNPQYSGTFWLPMQHMRGWWYICPDVWKHSTTTCNI